MIQIALARLLAGPLAKLVLIGVVLAGAQLAGFPVVELAQDTFASFGVAFDWTSLL